MATLTARLDKTLGKPSPKRKQVRRQNKKPNRTPAKIRPVPRRRLPRLPGVSGCALDYAMALANPFTGPLACVPSYPSIETRKFRTFIRGSFVPATGAGAGVGWIVADPLTAVTNDQLQLATSSATYVGSTIELHTGTTGLAMFTSNSDYSAAQFAPIGANNGDNVRVVSSGLRIQYAGTNLNCGGTIYMLQEPNHTSLQNYSINDFSGYNECVKQTIQPNKWYTLYYKPCTNPEITVFMNSGTFATSPTAATYSGVNNFYMGMFVVPAVATSPFNFEFFTTYEASGYGVRGKTPSTSDPVGFSRVENLTAHPDYATNAPSVLANITGNVGNYMTNKLGEIGDKAINGMLNYGMYRAYQNLQPRTDTRYHIS